MGDAWAKSGSKEKAIGAYKSAAEGVARDGVLPRAIAASKLVLEPDPAHKGVQQMLADLYARKTSPSDKRPQPSRGPTVERKVETPASSFANRKDAIDLPAFEVPGQETAPPAAMAATKGPSPM